MSDHVTQYQSAANPSWWLGFSPTGRPMSGSQWQRKWKRCLRFAKKAVVGATTATMSPAHTSVADSHLHRHHHHSEHKQQSAQHLFDEQQQLQQELLDDHQRHRQPHTPHQHVEQHSSVLRTLNSENGDGDGRVAHRKSVAARQSHPPVQRAATRDSISARTRTTLLTRDDVIT